MKTDSNGEEYLNTTETLSMTGMSQSWLWNQRKAGDLTAFKAPSGRLLFKKQDVLALMEPQVA